MKHIYLGEAPKAVDFLNSTWRARPDMPFTQDGVDRQIYPLGGAPCACRSQMGAALDIPTGSPMVYGLAASLVSFLLLKKGLKKSVGLGLATILLAAYFKGRQNSVPVAGEWGQGLEWGGTDVSLWE